MKKLKQILIVTLIMSATFAFPVQAAVNIGGTSSYSGSVINLHSYMYSTAQTQTAAQTQTTYTKNTPSSTGTTGSSVISLRNILNPYHAPSTPITAPSSTPSPTQTTSTNQTPQTATQPTTQPSSTTSSTSNVSSSTSIPMVTSLTPDEQSMVDMVNQERIKAGLRPLQVDLRLASVARAKANDMLVNNYFDHTSPTYGSPWAMMQQVGIKYKWAGENIAGNRSVAAAMTAFMQSPGHRANILDPRFTHIGIGIAPGGPYGNYFVQEFAQEKE